MTKTVFEASIIDTNHKEAYTETYDSFFDALEAGAEAHVNGGCATVRKVVREDDFRSIEEMITFGHKSIEYRWELTFDKLYESIQEINDDLDNIVNCHNAGDVVMKQKEPVNVERD